MFFFFIWKMAQLITKSRRAGQPVKQAQWRRSWRSSWEDSPVWELGMHKVDGVLVWHREGHSSLIGGGGHIYDDFSFLALGESAAWELTPLTPLAKNQWKNKIKNLIAITPEYNSYFQGRHWWFDESFCARSSPLSFFDLLFVGAGFFFKVWAWPCSLHRRSWKLMNFHIMKTWERQMAARTVILREKSH